jgi:putative transposase
MSCHPLRRGRHSLAGACYAVTIVVRHRQPLLRATPVASAVMAQFHAAPVRNLAWVVMPDHVHWLFELGGTGLSRCVQAFKSRSARAINALCGRKGALWQSEFYDHRVRAHEDLVRQARYIVANPVRKGLVERIEDYRYWWCPWVTCTADLYL